MAKLTLTNGAVVEGTPDELASFLTMTPQPKADPKEVTSKEVKAPKGKASKKATTKKVVIVRSKTLPRLQKEAPRFDGMTVEQVAKAVVDGKKKLPKGWAIGDGWKHKVTKGHFPEEGCC